MNTTIVMVIGDPCGFAPRKAAGINAFVVMILYKIYTLLA
jgi:hypothetical protein